MNARSSSVLRNASVGRRRHRLCRSAALGANCVSVVTWPKIRQRCVMQRGRHNSNSEQVCCKAAQEPSRPRQPDERAEEAPTPGVRRPRLIRRPQPPRPMPTKAGPSFPGGGPFAVATRRAQCPAVYFPLACYLCVLLYRRCVNLPRQPKHTLVRRSILVSCDTPSWSDIRFRCRGHRR
jgi:hypothetical protein